MLPGHRVFCCLQDAVKVLDAKTKELSAPADRLRTLLSAKDKKATLLEMAGDLLLLPQMYYQLMA